MGLLSDQSKEELLSALNRKEEGIFVIHGKLVSVEVENFEADEEDLIKNDLAEETEFPELKISLQRYLNSPDMQEVAKASDVILIHANNLTRQEYYNMVKKVRGWKFNKPIVCNEDSPCIGMLHVAYRTETSWGYYNNLTKQEPPADWRVTTGEDYFFARRVAEGIGIPLPPIPFEEQFYLQGFEPEITIDSKRWIRLASLYPETINFVEFYRNGELVDIAYNEPFMMKNETTWIQGPWIMTPEDREWKAAIHLADGRVIEKVMTL